MRYSKTSNRLIAFLIAMLLVCSLFGPAQKVSAAGKKTLYVGQTWKITISGTSTTIKWSCSNKKILAIKKISGKKNKTCRLTAKKSGKVKLTAKYGKNKKVFAVIVKKRKEKKKKDQSASIKITVPEQEDKKNTESKQENTTEKKIPESILELSEHSIQIKPGETKDIVLKVSSNDLANHTMQTLVSDTSVCTQKKTLIENAGGICAYTVTVTAKSNGTATISFICGKMKDVLIVKVIGGNKENNPGLSPEPPSSINTTEGKSSTESTEQTTENKKPYIKLSQYSVEYDQYTGLQSGSFTFHIPQKYVVQNNNDKDKRLQLKSSNTSVITSHKIANDGIPQIKEDEAIYTVNYKINTDIEEGLFATTPYMEIVCGNLSEKFTILIHKKEVPPTTAGSEKQENDNSYIKITRTTQGGKAGTSDYILVETKNAPAPTASCSDSLVCQFGSSNIENYNPETNTTVHKIVLNYVKKGRATITLKNSDGYLQIINLHVE